MRNGNNDQGLDKWKSIREFDKSPSIDADGDGKISIEGNPINGKARMPN